MWFCYGFRVLLRCCARQTNVLQVKYDTRMYTSYTITQKHRRMNSLCSRVAKVLYTSSAAILKPCRRRPMCGSWRDETRLWGISSLVCVRFRVRPSDKPPQNVVSRPPNSRNEYTGKYVKYSRHVRPNNGSRSVFAIRQISPWPCHTRRRTRNNTLEVQCNRITRAPFNCKTSLRRKSEEEIL